MQKYDLVVVGAGPGGYVAAIRAAQLGLKTACIEKEPTVGGTCLNVGCIPSKSLLHTSKLYDEIQHKSARYGIEATARFDFNKMIDYKNGVVASLNQGIKALFKKNKIDQIDAVASFLTPHTLQVGQEVIEADSILLATGSEPTSLPCLPFDHKQIVSSTDALSLTQVPNKLLIVGAGVIGLEIGTVYRRLGSQIHFIEYADRPCPLLDPSLSKGIERQIQHGQMTLDLNTRVTGGTVDHQAVTLNLVTQTGEEQTIQGDLALVCVGRRPYTQGLCLETIGLVTQAGGHLEVDGNFRTSHPHIYAIGDLIEGPMLAHKASEEGYIAAELIAGLRPHIDYIAIPNVVYTDPEIASVGLTETDLQQQNIPYRKAEFPLKANSRARCIDDTEGFVKLLAQSQTGQLLGAHLIAPTAGDLISHLCLAIEQHITVTELGHLCYAHPTLAEAIKEAALAFDTGPIHL